MSQQAGAVSAAGALLKGLSPYYVRPMQNHLLYDEIKAAELGPLLQAHLKDSADLVLDNHNKMSITIKKIMIFLLVDSLTINFLKNATAVTCKKSKAQKEEVGWCV